MQTFPPRVDAFRVRSRVPGADTRHPGDPDTSSPSRFLLWILLGQWRIVLVNTVTGLLWFLPSALSPYFMGRAVDEGVLAHDFGRTAMWAGLMFIAITIGVVGGVAMHTAAVTGWLIAMYRTTQLVVRKVAQLGHVMPRRTPTGEVLSVASGDADTFGATTEIVGRGIAALCAFIFVAGLVLSESVKLGVLVLVAAPLLVGAASPLLRPLQRAQATERSRLSELTGMATDIVAGLRILRGVGGEKTFGDNYANQSQKVRASGVVAGTWQAGVDSLSVLLSGLLLVALTWLGTREMLAGELSIGQLISFFGYAIFMVWPIQTFFELVQKWVQGLVAAQKTIATLGQQSPWHAPASPVPLPSNAPIVDAVSGFIAQPGQLTVVVSALPDDSSALADRIGRYLPSDEEAVSTDVDDNLKGRARKHALADKLAERAERAKRDEALAAAQWGVTVGGVDLSDVALEELRSRILVSDSASLVFAGTMQQLIDPHGRATREQAEEVVRVANAEDVYDALPGGWQGVLDERGRGLSGGQRQRLVLARALLVDPEVLVLVEPTSAVDAHTEARIAARLAEHRRGRTTIVTSVSPLLLHHADDVVLLEDGVATVHGTHTHLLATSEAYRSVVARGMEDDA
ncbi:MAG TPA: ABC transporter ATP-binding protein [Propionibacteriaceae bacterium]|nr:ABC transporter ATP-binding protein [Propionibacteriaceae bacterium]